MESWGPIGGVCWAWLAVEGWAVGGEVPARAAWNVFGTEQKHSDDEHT